jgi:Fe-S-cluster containining protein
MDPVNFRSFKKKLSIYRKYFRIFLNKTEKTPPPGIDKLTPGVEQQVWAEIDCLTCANCCKTMTPTFTVRDIKRISKHFNETPEFFIKTRLRKDRNKDLINKTEPCPLLNLSDNKCSIYEIRPVDCSGFPHLSKRKWSDYAHVHKQNLDYCPATFKMVEKLIARIHEGENDNKNKIT